jgi:Tfp pilus assembly protein PilF
MRGLPLARSLPLVGALALAAWSSGCVTPPPAPIGLIDVAERPAEKQLLAGMRAYDDAQYPAAEQLLMGALNTGLNSPRDRAVAHKLLAFIACTSKRLEVCEAHFRTARAIDPSFALTKAEAGHPQWGPVYQRLKP